MRAQVPDQYLMLELQLVTCLLAPDRSSLHPLDLVQLELNRDHHELIFRHLRKLDVVQVLEGALEDRISPGLVNVKNEQLRVIDQQEE